MILEPLRSLNSQNSEKGPFSLDQFSGHMQKNDKKNVEFKKINKKNKKKNKKKMKFAKHSKNVGKRLSRNNQILLHK